MLSITPILIALVVGGAVGFASMLVMNRGNPAFVNLRAQDEPFLVGVGVALLTWSVLADAVVVFTAGMTLALLGVVSRYTTLVDFDSIV